MSAFCNRAIDKTMNITERRKTTSVPPGQLSSRRQRIDRWVYKGRNESMNDRARQSFATLGTSLIQKRSDSSLIQTNRRLNMDLYQLGEEREKLLERYSFDQKLFANKQALRHKDSPDILRTLDYVRKCCKYPQANDHESEFISPTIFFEDSLSTKTPTVKRNLSNNTSLLETFLRHNKQDIESSSYDEENEKHHVQFQMNTKRGSQSAHVSSKSRSLPDPPSVHSAHEIRTTNSAPPIITIDHKKEPIKPSSKPKRPSSRIFTTKHSLQEFRRYPERFLSQSNRYLPLLRRQATEIKAQELYLKQQKDKKQHTQSLSRFSEGSDVFYDDAKSFLSEEIEIEKPPMKSPDGNSHNHRNTTKLRAPNKINLMETISDNTSEQQIALSRFRDLEYANLQKLIRSNSIKHILEPLSPIKTSENKHRSSIQLNEILHSIDSLSDSKTTKKSKQKRTDIEKSLSKLGLLIF